MAKDIVETLVGAGLGKSFAYHVANNKRGVSLPLALWLYETDGIRVGPLDGKTPSEIKVLRAYSEPRVPETVLRRREALAQ